MRLYGRIPVLEALLDDSITVTRLVVARPIDDVTDAARRRGIKVERSTAENVEPAVRQSPSRPGRRRRGRNPEPPRARRLGCRDGRDGQAESMIGRSRAARWRDDPGERRDDHPLGRRSGRRRRRPSATRRRTRTSRREGVRGTRLEDVASPLHHCGRSGRRTRGRRLLRSSALAAGRGTSVLEDDVAHPACFVAGSETDGVSDDITEIVKVWRHIPLAAGVESLNVAVATSIALFATR